jgi:hypothetical protein
MNAPAMHLIDSHRCRRFVPLQILTLRPREPVSVLEQFFQAIRVKLFNQLDNLGAKICRCFLCVRHVEIDYAM